MFNQRSRLRVVNHDKVGIEIEDLGVPVVNLEIGLGHLLGKRLFLALQRIADSFGGVEILLVACENFPPRFDSQRRTLKTVVKGNLRLGIPPGKSEPSAALDSPGRTGLFYFRK